MDQAIRYSEGSALSGDGISPIISELIASVSKSQSPPETIVPQSDDKKCCGHVIGYKTTFP
jgi:hypothetical protein